VGTLNAAVRRKNALCVATRRKYESRHIKQGLGYIIGYGIGYGIGYVIGLVFGYIIGYDIGLCGLCFRLGRQKKLLKFTRKSTSHRIFQNPRFSKINQFYSPIFA
jgi:hypothetical protein